MNGVLDFLSRRKVYTSEYFACAGSRKTVLISSYIWWTELMAYGLLRLGYNVLVAEPWYGMWVDERRWEKFDSVYRQWIEIIRKMNVQLVIGGNATLIVPHPRTGELLHRAAGVPAVNYWWDEPRNDPPMLRRGLTLEDHIRALKDDRTLNVFWDIDIREEMEAFYGVDGVHVPLGATPELWQTQPRPLADRPSAVCFLGNNHDEGTWRQTADPAVLKWAQAAARLKLADLDRPMVQCVQEAGAPAESGGNASAATSAKPGGNSSTGPSVQTVGSSATGYKVAADLKAEFARWKLLDAVLLTECRNRIVKAVADRLGDQFVLIGKGWERLGLKAAKEHSGVPGAKDYYVQSRASLNLFGGCVHGGMPLRPYEIAAAHGLLFTQYNRELPSLFEPGKECVAFRDESAMRAGLEKILAAPGEFDRVVEAGRRRVVAEHTWEKRLEAILNHAKDRFALPW